MLEDIKKGNFYSETKKNYLNFDFISAKEAMKIIRKRLQIVPGTQNWRSVALTLTV